MRCRRASTLANHQGLQRVARFDSRPDRHTHRDLGSRTANFFSAEHLVAARYRQGGHVAQVTLWRWRRPNAANGMCLEIPTRELSQSLNQCQS